MVDIAAELMVWSHANHGGTHWLCGVLTSIRRAIDPGTAVDAVAFRVAARLSAEGLPRPQAELVAANVRRLAHLAVDGVDPAAQMRMVLLVSALAAYPAPANCSHGLRNSFEVVKETVFGEFPPS